MKKMAKVPDSECRPAHGATQISGKRCWPLRLSVALNVVMALAIVAFGAYKVVPKFIGGGYDYESNQFYDPYVSVFEEAVAKQNVDVCFAGDSLTARGLWSEFFPDVKVSNRGIGSDTSEGLLNRLDTVVEGAPDVVFIMIGINDVGHKVPQQETVFNVAAICDELHALLPDTTVVLQAVLPARINGTLAEDAVHSLNEGYCLVADERAWVEFADFHDAFLNADKLNTSLYCEDGVHLTGAGYRTWIEAVAGYVPLTD